MNPLETGIEELNELSKKPSAELLEKFFLKRTAAWAYPVIDIGCASVGVCNGLVSALKPESAFNFCLLYTSPSPRDQRGSRMPSSA